MVYPSFSKEEDTAVAVAAAADIVGGAVGVAAVADVVGVEAVSVAIFVLKDIC